MKVRATITEVRKAERIDVYADGMYLTYIRVDGEWFEGGDIAEEPGTDADRIQCDNVIKGWDTKGRVIFDYTTEFAKWIKSDQD